MMKNKMRLFLENRNLKIILSGLAILVVAFGATYAWWTASVEAKQDVTMGKLRISADFNELTEPKGFEPGTNTAVNGTIRNDGDIPAMVKIINSSQIKFVFADDQLNAIPREERGFGQDVEGAVKLEFGPTSGDYFDNDGAYWFVDTSGTNYVLLDEGASVDVTSKADFDGSVMGNKYQQSQVRIGALLNATQVIEGALSDEFGVTLADLSDIEEVQNQNTRSKRSISRGQARLQELISRGR